MSGGSVVDRQPPRPIRAWLDSLCQALGAQRWTVAIREGGTWALTADTPAVYDAVLAQVVNDHVDVTAPVAMLLEMHQLGAAGTRLATDGVDRLLVIPGGPDARIILDVPNVAEAQRFIAAATGLGTTFDLAAALRQEQHAADLIALAQWWPDDGDSPSTQTLEGTLLAGQIASVAARSGGSPTELRHNALLRERARIASVIHEGITQVLTNVSVQLEVLRHSAENPDVVRELVGMSRDAVLESLESLRAVIFDLNPPEEEWADLISGLRSFLDDYASQWGIAVTFNVDGDARDVDAEIISTVFAFVQEGLTNVRRHAQTDAATVTVTFASDRLHVAVQDEGAGIQPHDTDGLRPHQGLNIVKSRVRLLQGSVRIDSSPGAGTTVAITVPA